MCLRTLHDRVRNLGLGAMYDKHLACGFRDLFDNASPEWSATEMPQKVIDLKGFAAAGVPPEELIAHYRETLALEGNTAAEQSLPGTMAAYRDAGFWPPLPGDVDAALDGAPNEGSAP